VGRWREVSQIHEKKNCECWSIFHVPPPPCAYCIISKGYHLIHEDPSTSPPLQRSRPNFSKQLEIVAVPIRWKFHQGRVISRLNSDGIRTTWYTGVSYSDIQDAGFDLGRSAAHWWDAIKYYKRQVNLSCSKAWTGRGLCSPCLKKERRKDAGQEEQLRRVHRRR
jgi:transposase